MGSWCEEIARKNDALWICPKVMGANPSERWGHSSCYFDSFLYIFGGCRGGVHFSDVLVCNLETMSWTILKTSGQGPGPRDSHSAVLVGHKMLVFGGTNGSKKVNDLHILDLQSREWTRPDCHGNLPSPRESHTANVVGDEKLIVFGGSGEGKGNCLNDLHILDLKTMEWSSPKVRGNIPAPRDSHSSVAVGNRIFVFGGDSGDRYQGDVAILDINTLIWSKLNTHGPLPGPRAGHASVSIGTKVYILGGVGDKKYYNDVWVLDVITSSWDQLNARSHKSQGRFSHSATVTNLGIAVFGGCGEDEHPLNELLFLQIDSFACRAFRHSSNEENQKFGNNTENHLKPILVGENEDLASDDVQELEFIPKESFHFSSDMLHPKRRRTSNSKLYETNLESETHSRPQSQNSSPSQSDHEQSSIKKSYSSPRAHPLFRQKISRPSNYQINHIPLNPFNPRHAISRPSPDIFLSSEQSKQERSNAGGIDSGSKAPGILSIRNLIGAEVHGQVDGAFDSGYLMTATVNGKIFRGVLFAPGPDCTQRGTVPGQHPPSFATKIAANSGAKHFNVAHPRQSHQHVKLFGPGTGQTQSRLPPETRTPLTSSKDSKLNSELQGVVLTLAPGSDLGTA